MDNTLVSARIPKAKKERASSILSALGATASDLINSAYDYVIATNQLPVAQNNCARQEDSSFADFVKLSTLDVDWSKGTADDYKALMKDWRRSDYESLA